jgi:hypothetical protein
MTNNTITLDLHVSCKIFSKYQLKVHVDCDDYLGWTDDINMLNSSFSRLERYLCDTMISHIHEDLALNNDQDKIEQLCEIASKFHIHGHTAESILVRQANSANAEQGGVIYICTHC